jgi:HEXXH motif-containing protein
MLASAVRPKPESTPAAGLAVPRDLTIPADGSTTARAVLSAAMRRALSELRRLPAQWAPAPEERPDHAAFARTVEALFAAPPGLAASLVRRPTVGTLLRCLRPSFGADPARSGAILRALRAQLAFELACLDALPAPLTLRHLPDQVLSIPANLALRFPAGVTAARFAPGRVTLVTPRGEETHAIAAWAEGGDRPDYVTRPYRPITPALRLALADNNPLQMFEAHPDKAGNAIDLGGRGGDEWCATLRDALDLVAEHLPALREEIDLFLHLAVPVGYDEHKHLSASYQEALGAVYLTLHPNLMTMTEAVIHEFSHNKLNALLELDPVLHNAFWPLYASPVRPDPRPLQGVLLAVHAFQPVARLYESMTAAGHPRARHPDFQRRFAQIRGINHAGAGVVLAHGQPTALGRGLLDEIGRWDRHYGAQPAPDARADL